MNCGEVLEVKSLTLVVCLVDSSLTGTNSYLMRKARVTVYKGDTADYITKLSIFLYRHRSISASESR